MAWSSMKIEIYQGEHPNEQTRNERQQCRDPRGKPSRWCRHSARRDQLQLVRVRLRPRFRVCTFSDKSEDLAPTKNQKYQSDHGDNGQNQLIAPERQSCNQSPCKISSLPPK